MTLRSTWIGAGVAVAVWGAVVVEAGAETRGFVISMIHTATYAAEDTCPQGRNGGPVETRHRRLLAAGYSADEARLIIANGGTDADGQRVGAISLFGSNAANGGQPWNGQAVSPGNVPALVPDPDLRTAEGRYAYGFDLDGETSGNDFEDPESGEPGVDNHMWRALGCFDVYHVRRPVVPYSESIVWDTAIDAMPAWVLSVRGEDLDRDGDVTVTFDRALNVVLRDAYGGVMSGATFTIDPDPRSHSVFAGRIEDGVLSIEPGDFSMQGESQFYPVLQFTDTHLRLTVEPDGSLQGIIGGYQPWRDYYHFLAVRGEVDGQVDLPGVYYAMERLAEAAPDPLTGSNTAISAAYWMEAVPAFHATLDGEIVAESVGTGPKFSGPAANRAR